MDFKDLAFEAKNIDLAVKQKKKVATTVSFAIELIGYPDIVISKSTARQKKMLVLMPTQDKFYIKNNDGSAEVLTIENLRSFVTGMNENDIMIPEDFWFDRLPCDKKECEKFMNYLNTPTNSQMIKDKAAPKMDYGNTMHSMRSKIEEIATVYETCPAIFKTFRDNVNFHRFIEHNPGAFKTIVNHYGIDSARRFFDALALSLLSTDSNWCGYYDTLREILRSNPDIDTFTDYVCYESVCMGYADNPSTFFLEWCDVLRMQNDLYGKIKEKYPSNLPTLHMQLAYKSRLYMASIEKVRFEKQSIKAHAFEKRIGDWIFLAPDTSNDFMDEATQQANCLASYVSGFANGDDYIMFMRKADEPEKSVITIEISTDGKLLQAYRARNRACSAEEHEVIERWLDYVGEVMSKKAA